MEQFTNDAPQKRPDQLTVICILTFIGSGLAAFSNIIIYLNFEMLLDIYNSGELSIPGSELIFSFQRSFFFISFLFYSTSLFGAIQMWKLQRRGFHYYTIAQILLLILPSLFVKSDQFPTLAILLTGGFIFLYYRHLKFMN